MIKIGNAPCSWGIIETITQNRFSADQVLAQISKSGYVGSELGDWGFLPTDPNALRDFAGTYNLVIMASWVSVKLQDNAHFEEDKEQCLRVARLLNAAFPEEEHRIVLGNDPFVDKERIRCTARIQSQHFLKHQNPAQWQIFVQNADALADIVKSETGVEVVFHHHAGTWVETDEEIEALLDGTQRLGLCFDTGHYEIAGGIAAEGIKKYASRIRHIHFKDCNGELLQKGIQEEWDVFQYYKAGIFPELGKGTVDFEYIAKEIKAMNYSGWIIVEQDILDDDISDPYQSALNNREFIRNLEHKIFI